MVWRKVKKVIIPLIIIKIVILAFFIFRGDAIRITRDFNYSSNYEERDFNDSLAFKKQKLIRIVRNEDDHGVSIILRSKKNTRLIKEKERGASYPLVD